MQNEKWDAAHAISELVDNSFGEGRGNADTVYVNWCPKARVLSVLDNGRGMDDPADLFQLGRTAGRSVRDIGKYGSGGTTACLWLGSSVKVWTVRDRKVSWAVANWKQIRESLKWTVPLSEPVRMTVHNTPLVLYELGRGTLVEIMAARDKRFYPDVIRRELAQTYAPALRHGRKLIWSMSWVAEESLVSAHERPDLVGAFSSRVSLEYEGVFLNASLHAGIVPEERSDRS